MQWDGVEYDPATLTVPELEMVELIALRPFGQVDPLLRVADFTALLTTFLMRTMDGDAVQAIIEVATLDDIGNSVVLTGA